MKKSLLQNQQKLQKSYHSIHQAEIQNTNILSHEQQHKTSGKPFHRKELYLKLMCVAFLVSGFFYYRFGNFVNINTSCILDAYQQYTFNANRKLADGWDNVIIGIGQVIMDGWIVACAIFWVAKINNFRLPIAVSIFFGIRSIFLLIQKFPFPPYMVWHSPGFIALTVPYDHTRDFFFSGHTGSLTIILLQFSQLTINHSKKLVGYIWVFAFICLIYMMNMLIITKVHYTADVIGGLLFSIYFYWLVGLFTVQIDKLMSLPYVYIVKPLIQKIKQKKKIGQYKNQVQAENIQTFEKSINDKLINEIPFSQK